MTNLIDKDASFHMVDFLLYRSYAAQRDLWFNPQTCSEDIYNGMKLIYPSLEEYEKTYLNKEI